MNIGLGVQMTMHQDRCSASNRVSPNYEVICYISVIKLQMFVVFWILQYEALKKSSVNQGSAFVILVDLTSLMLYARIQHQHILSFGRFLNVFNIYEHGYHFDQVAMPVLAIFCSP